MSIDRRPKRPTFTEQEALQFHQRGKPGKLEINPTKPMATQRDLSLAYSPGVAVPVRKIAEDPDTARRAGADPVDLRRAVGPLFVDDPDAMFSADRFHPSPLGYRRTAEALLPAVVRAAERIMPPDVG